MRLCAFADEAAASLEEQIKALERNGISLLEIRHVDGENIADISASKACEIRKMLDASGISVWSIGSPIGKYSLGKDFAPHLDAFRRTVEIAQILGASNIRLFSFFTENAPKTDAMREEVIARLDAFCNEAPHSILLCHENEKEIFGDDIESCLALYKALPRMRAVFDPANFVQCGENTEKAFETLAPYVEYMHVKDALADGTVVPAGDGKGKLGLILRKYAQNGGDVVTLEPHLKAFIGLERLERGNDMKTAFSYVSCGEAFDFAALKLKQILSDIEKEH